VATHLSHQRQHPRTRETPPVPLPRAAIHVQSQLHHLNVANGPSLLRRLHQFEGVPGAHVAVHEALREIGPEELPLEAEHRLRREGLRNFWEEPRLHLPQAGASRLEHVGPCQGASSSFPFCYWTMVLNLCYANLLCSRFW